jgi:hypothetical protein
MNASPHHFTTRRGLDLTITLILPILNKALIPSMVMYLCARSTIVCLYFYDFLIGLWNFYDCDIVCFSFYCLSEPIMDPI